MGRADLNVKMNLDSTKLNRGLARAQTSIRNFAAQAISRFAGIAAVMGAVGLSRSAIQLGSKISDMSVQLNIGTEALQALQFAAKKAGVESSILERAIRNVQLRTQQAADGNKSYGDALDRLGINILEFKKLRPEEQLEAIAIAQQNATDKTEAYNDVSRILGEKAGPAMQEVLQKLAQQGFGDLTKAAKDAGQVMDEETIGQLDEASDRIDLFKNKMIILAGNTLPAAIPIFSMIGDVLAFIGKGLNQARKTLGKFGESVGTIIAVAIQPAISVFNSLSLAIQASDAALRGNLKEAKNLGKQSISELAGIKDEALAIPGAIKDAFGNIKDFTIESFNVSTEAANDMTQGIKDSFAELTGETKGAKKEIDKLGESGVKTGKKIADAFGDNDDLDPKIRAEKELNELRLGILQAEISGDTKKAAALQKRLDLTERILQITQQTGASEAQARQLAMAEASKKEDDSIVTGRDERRAATAARKAESEQRRARTRKVGRQSREDLEARRAGTASRISEREAAAGLTGTMTGRFGAGKQAVDEFGAREAAAGLGDTMGTRTNFGRFKRPMGAFGAISAMQPGGMTGAARSGMKGAGGQEKEAPWQTAIIEMKSTISKLDAAISGD